LYSKIGRTYTINALINVLVWPDRKQRIIIIIIIIIEFV